MSWRADWAWGMPLIVVTVLIHVLGLVMIHRGLVPIFRLKAPWRHPVYTFVTVMGCTTLLVTILHGIEAFIWAVAYRFLGALSDINSAMLYSLNAITSYGHTNLRLDGPWSLMGSFEALNGWLLFGLTAAFLFAMTQRFLLLDGRHFQ
jgi:hypothetical protein